MIKVLVVDDHLLLVESLKFMIEQDEEIEVVGTATNGCQALEQCKKIKPDVILMDIRMPKMDGVSASKEIKKLYPDTKILILTTFEESDSILESIAVGADGYLLKNMNPKELICSIKLAAKGVCVLSKNVMKMFMSCISGRSCTQKLEVELSKEDIDIIELLSSGKTNKEIAGILNYSEGTVKNRVSKMINLLNVKDRTQLVVYAIQNDLI